jgi:exonuclease VII large subunit
MTEWNIETALNHHAGCSVYDDGACTCGLRARREQIERSPLAPGEGTWSVFAQKVVEERDALKEVVQTLKARLVDAEQKLLDAECERDASRGMEKAAEIRAERLYRERERLTECNEAMREPMRRLRDAMGMPAQGEGYVVDSIIKERDEALRLLATRVEAKRLDEAQEEIERLREAAKQAREALRDCLRSASTNRLVDVIGDAMTALEQAGVKP